MLYENEEQKDRASNRFMNQVWKAKYGRLDEMEEDDDERA